MLPIIPPVDKDLIVSEIESRFFCKTQKANNEIYLIDAHSCPSTIKEIGRLREISFRDGGGGSGNQYDLDEFDFLEKPFKQLIIWNPVKKEIIGGYRFLHCKDVEYDRFDEPKLPMRHIFKFSKKYLSEYMPYTIELGRAFVQPKYQSFRMGLKSLYSLDNLWDGIGAILEMNRDVKYLVGKVTIFSQIQIEARYSIIYFLKRFFRDKDKLILPEAEEVIPLNFKKYFDSYFTKSEIKENFKLLTSYLKSRNESLPPLIKAYIELSTSMRSFGTCLDTDFGNIYDTGIMITIDDIYTEKKERYMSWYLKKKSASIIISKNRAL